jgi:hypothetical protein
VTRAGDTFSGDLRKADATGITIELEIKKSKKEIEKKTVELGYGEIKSAKVKLRFKH